MEAAQHLVFPPFRLDLVNRQLWRGSKLVELRPKTWAVLHYLVEHPDRLITREELLQAVWPKRYVSPGLVKVCMRELRAALGDEAGTPRFIETVGRQGYRFIAPLSTAPIHSQKAESHKVESPHSTIVGREAELGQLHRALEKGRRGERQVVFVTGEPGIGKTTVVDAFLSQLGTDKQSAPIRQQAAIIGRGQCIEHYGKGEAYLPVLEALGLIGRGPEGARLIAVLRQYAPSWLVQMPAFLSAAELDTLQRTGAGVTHERMLRELVEALDALTAVGAPQAAPLVLVLEDLHWSDYSTVEWLAAVAQRRIPARLLVIGTYRSTEVSLSEHPLKGVKRELQAHRQCEELVLQFLTPDDITQYLTLRYPRHQFPSTLAPALHHSTEGNPLFLTSLLDYLISQGTITEVAGQWRLQRSVEELVGQVPENLRQLIEKQIERLSPEDQEVLEVASVAGAEFSAAVVASGLEKTVGEVERRCESLARREQLVQRRGTAEWPDGTVAARHSFGHALYQEVLYERIPAGRRAELHRQLGARLEQGYGEQASEIAAELAVHFERGRDYRRAVQYHQQAAETALRRSAHIEAITHLARGLELIKTLPATPERIQHELTLQIALGIPLIATKGYAAPEVRDAYARARELCLQVGDSPQLFPALWGSWAFYAGRAEYQTARELGEQLLTSAAGVQDPVLFLGAYEALGLALFYLGDFGKVRAHLEQGITLYKPQHHHSHVLLYGQDQGMACLSYVALALWHLGYPELARQRSHEALRLAQELSHPYSLVVALVMAACLAPLRREGHVAQERAEAALAHATEQGFAFWLALARMMRGWALVEQGGGQEGISEIQQGLAACWNTGAEVMLTYFLALLTEAYEKVGQAEEGLQVLAEALNLVQKNGESFYEAELYRLYGALSLRIGEAETRRRTRRTGERENRRTEGNIFLSPLPRFPDSPILASSPEECFHKAIAIARQQEAKSLELRAVMSLSRLWQQQGKQKEARRMLSGIYGWFTEGFDTADLKDAKALLQELSH